MNLLAIETATDVCGVALVQDGRLVAELSLRRPRAHAENLVPMIQDALRYGGLESRAVEAVAVSAGPGSYTGLRIGASTAKGLAAAVDARLVAVPSLEALAACVASTAAPGDAILAAFNSRRDELYVGVFLVEEDGALKPHRDPAALAVDELPGLLADLATDRLWLVGEGAEKAAAALNAFARIRLLDPARFLPSAASVARLALPKLAAGRTEDLAAFEPFYLKAFIPQKRQQSAFERLSF